MMECVVCVRNMIFIDLCDICWGNRVMSGFLHKCENINSK